MLYLGTFPVNILLNGADKEKNCQDLTSRFALESVIWEGNFILV